MAIKQAILKSIALALLLAVAAFSPAPIHDPIAAGPKKAEKTEDQRAQDQVFNKTIGEQGVVPKDTEVEALDNIRTEGQAKDRLAAVNASKLDDDRASRNLREAGKSQARKGGPNWWLGLLLAVVGFGCLFGLKTWADRKIPQPKAKRIPPTDPTKRDIRW
jgi:hypothetical protein